MREVYSDIPEKLVPKDLGGNPKQLYYFKIVRDTETGADHILAFDKNLNLVDMDPRIDINGNPYATSTLTSQ